MKLNDALESAQAPIESEAQNLLRDLINNAVASLSVAKIPSCNEQNDRAYTTFFEKYYVRANTSGLLTKIDVTTKVSTIEADIINFFTSDSADLTPYLFVDHAGRGKSTILKYIRYYLFNTELALREILLPIYITLRPHEVVISQFSKVTDLLNYLSGVIKEASFHVAYEYFLKNPCTVLKWVNRSYKSLLQGRYPDDFIDTISKNPARYYADLATNDQNAAIELIIGTLCYYSQNEKRVVLFLDDADNFTMEIQQALLKYAELKISDGLKVLVALRTSTWNSLESFRRDSDPRRSEPISWSYDELKTLLTTRLNNGKEIVTLRMNNYRKETNQEQLIVTFFNLLVNDQTERFLLLTSNYNLHSLMRKLQLIPASWHFKDKTFLRQQLMGATTERNAPAFRIILNLILGSYRGTFKSSDQMARCGIINCFCTVDSKQDSYSFFIRVHLLTRLIRNMKESDCVSVKKLYNEYREIFGENLNLTHVFNRALFRMIQAGLVLTSSCRRYQGEAEIEAHIHSDHVYLSEAGKYYVEWLINRIDYLFFMKDDIDWPESFNDQLGSIDLASKNCSIATRHRMSLASLYLLMSLEIDMLKELQSNLNAPKCSAVVQSYLSLFSPKRLPGRNTDMLITEVMLKEYCEYLNWLLPTYRKEFEPELQRIDGLLCASAELKGAFSL